MKSFFSFLLTVIIWLPIAALSQEAPSKGFALDASMGFFSDYMFRGFNYYDGLSLQPSVTPSYYLPHFGTISGNVWSHVSGESDRKDENFTEVDYSIRWDFALGPVGVALGHYWYTFPHDNTNAQIRTREYLFALTGDIALSPTISFYNDYDSFDTQYYELGFSHEVTADALGDCFAVTPFLALGFASDGHGVYHDNGLVQITGGLSFDLHLGDIGVTPTLNYTYGVDENTSNEFWTGLTFTFSA